MSGLGVLRIGHLRQLFFKEMLQLNTRRSFRGLRYGHASEKGIALNTRPAPMMPPHSHIRGQSGLEGFGTLVLLLFSELSDSVDVQLDLVSILHTRCPELS